MAEARPGQGRLRRGSILVGGVGLAAAVLAVPRTAAAAPRHWPAGDSPPARFEVAENGLRFAFASAPVHADGLPAYGNPFVTEGFLYPSGTLAGTNGVLADGRPEFPERVLGTWICRGYMIGDGAHTESGPWVTSTQTYTFGAGVGAATLITEGFELADTGVAVARAVIGGTGPFRGAWGEQRQTLLGFTEQMGVNLRVSLDVQPR